MNRLPDVQRCKRARESCRVVGRYHDADAVRFTDVLPPPLLDDVPPIAVHRSREWGFPVSLYKGEDWTWDVSRSFVVGRSITSCVDTTSRFAIAFFLLDPSWRWFIMNQNLFSFRKSVNPVVYDPPAVSNQDQETYFLQDCIIYEQGNPILEEASYTGSQSLSVDYPQSTSNYNGYYTQGNQLQPQIQPTSTTQVSQVLVIDKSYSNVCFYC